MKVVIVGGGNVGTFIASELTAGGHDVTIIELEADRVARAKAIGEPAGVRWVLADACEVDNLRKVPLDDVDVLAAVTGTTRTTSWSRCWPSRSSRCRASSPA